MIWALGTRVCREEYMNKLKNGDIVKTFVYNYMFINGSTEEEALNNQEEKMIFSLEVCQSFLQASQDNLKCSHEQKEWDKRTTLGWSYPGYHYCWTPNLQAGYVYVGLPVYTSVYTVEGKGPVKSCLICPSLRRQQLVLIEIDTYSICAFSFLSGNFYVNTLYIYMCVCINI